MRYQRTFLPRGKRLLVAALMIATTMRSGESSAVVMLPPFMVEEMVRGNSWTYSQIAGFEILSRCTEGRTRELALSFYRPHELLRLVLPDRFLVNFDVPKALVLYDEALWDAGTQEAMAAMLRPAHSRPAPARPLPRRSTREAALPDWVQKEEPPQSSIALGQQSAFLTNLMLTDTDSMTIFSIVPRVSPDTTLSRLTPSYVGHLLGRRTPKLPTWLEVGFLTTYAGMKFSDDAIKLEAMRWPSGLAGSPLLPMDEFLADDALTRLSDRGNALQVWFAQAELFVRWALDPTQARAGPFWTFVERTATESVNETVFQECFGFGYKAANEQLAAWLASSASRSMTWRSRQPVRMPDLELRRATRTEIARIKGDWERLEADYVRKTLPELEPKYRDLARKTLRRGHKPNDPNALLLAVEGLCEVDAGDDAVARSLLEQAVSMGMMRPRAYCELARIRFEELRSKSTRDDGKIDAASALELSELLAAGRRQAPPQVAGYELLAAILSTGAGPPRPADFAVLKEGLSLFPTSGTLVEKVARLYLESGFNVEAANIVETGRQQAGNENTRQRLADLAAEISGRMSLP